MGKLTPLTRWFPLCGPCLLCGHQDKRHRLWDCIIERNEAGESIEELAEDYGLPAEAIREVIELRPYAEEGQRDETI